MQNTSHKKNTDSVIDGTRLESYSCVKYAHHLILHSISNNNSRSRKKVMAIWWFSSSSSHFACLPVEGGWGWVEGQWDRAGNQGIGAAWGHGPGPNLAQREWLPRVVVCVFVGGTEEVGLEQVRGLVGLNPLDCILNTKTHTFLTCPFFPTKQFSSKINVLQA